MRIFVSTARHCHDVVGSFTRPIINKSPLDSSNRREERRGTREKKARGRKSKESCRECNEQKKQSELLNVSKRLARTRGGETKRTKERKKERKRGGASGAEVRRDTMQLFSQSFILQLVPAPHSSTCPLQNTLQHDKSSSVIE